MHYVDFNAKTKQTVIRFSLYGFFGLIAIMISIIVVFAARGFDIDPSTGQVIRNGLVLLWSQPEAGDVYINGELEDDTPARLPLPSGTYDIRIAQDGYIDWNKSVTVDGSEVIKLNYPRLFAQDISTVESAQVNDVKFWRQSPDQKSLAVYNPGLKRTVLIYDAEDLSQTPLLISVPIDSLTAVDEEFGEFTDIQWSADSRFILVEHVVNEEIIEYIRINVETEEFVNINQQLDLDLTQVEFDRSENNLLYGLTNGNLRLINLSSNTTTGAIESGVLKYHVSNDGRPVAIQREGTNARLTIVEPDGEIRVVYSDKLSGEPQLELGNFEGEHYALMSFDDKTAQLVLLDAEQDQDPVLSEFTTDSKLMIHPVSFTARFAKVSAGETLIVHDFDKLRVYQYDKTGLSQAAVSWLDDSHISTVINKKAVVFDFDGSNQVTLADSLDYRLFAGRDFRNFYHLTPGEAGKINITTSNLRP